MWQYTLPKRNTSKVYKKGNMNNKIENRNLTLVKYRQNNPCLTLQEIGDEFGITRERARQVLSKHNAPTVHKTDKLIMLCRQCGKPCPGKRTTFCSNKCSFDYHHVWLTCDYCGKTFPRMVSLVLLYPSRLAHNPQNYTFCNHSCQGKYFSERRRKKAIELYGD
jgi:predicted nucleic acid-binding Zn ribbon protein